MKSEKNITLMAEEGASLSSGSLRLYATLHSAPSPALPGMPPASLLLSTPLSPIGCVELYNYDPLNRRAAVGIMVSKQYRRQGYALAMLNALVQQVAGSKEQGAATAYQLPATGYQLHTLYADIAATNTASIALFQKAGYEQCGLFHDWLLVGDTFIDSIRMQKTL